jgi:hypothetical protein
LELADAAAAAAVIGSDALPLAVGAFRTVRREVH